MSPTASMFTILFFYPLSSNFKCLTWPANVLSCNMLENHEKSICAMQETSLDIQDIRILVLVATKLGLL